MIALLDLLSSQYVKAAIFFCVFLIIARIVFVIIEKYLHKIFQRTKNNLDDQLLKTIKKPFYYLILLIGLNVAVNILSLKENIQNILTNIISSFIILLIITVIIKIIDIFIDNWGRTFALKTKSTIDDAILPLFHKTSKAVLLLVGLIFILNIWDVNVTGLLAGLGIAGIVIGLAVKDSLANIFGGISIILDRAFKVGDTIKLDSGETGTIHDIGLRSTRIKTLDNEILIVPNNIMANTKITNCNLPTLSTRINIEVGVEYGSDPDKVRKVILDTLSKIKRCFKRSKARSYVFRNGRFCFKI